MHIASLTALWQKRLKRATLYGYTSELRRFLRVLNPGAENAVPRIRRSRAHFPAATPDEISRLVALAPPWLRAILIIVRDTALRREDAKRLSAAQCSLENRTVRIEQKKTKEEILLPLSPELEALIRAAPPGPETQPIADRYNGGKPVTENRLNENLRKLRDRAGVTRNITLHSLRRTAALVLYDLTKDLRAVQQLLGHTELHSTLEYIESADPERLRPLLQQIWIPKGPVQ